jgi:hypothetical protein
MNRANPNSDRGGAGRRRAPSTPGEPQARIPRSSLRALDWRPGRVYFLTILEPSQDDRAPALTARSASHVPPYGAKESKIKLCTASAAP